MPFDDLDLEFEDEDEAKKKKSEAVQVDVDLEFAAPEGARPRPVGKPLSQPSVPGASRPAPRPVAEVKKIEDARAAASGPQAKRPASAGPPTARPSGSPMTAGSSALKEDYQMEVEGQEVLELREQMRRVEFEAQVKVSVAEFKTELLSELNGDMKLLEHQIGQLLIRINAKHPDMKQEVLMIKKILADFTAKKRK